jgi:hypothetical protein
VRSDSAPARVLCVCVGVDGSLADWMFNSSHDLWTEHALGTVPIALHGLLCAQHHALDSLDVYQLMKHGAQHVVPRQQVGITAWRPQPQLYSRATAFVQPQQRR